MMGTIGVLASMVVTLIFYAFAKQANPVKDFYQLVVQVTGLLGVMCMAWSFVLAIRHKFWERMFGGLDQVYKIHHIVGGMSLVLLLQHPVFLLIRGLPQNMLQLYLVPGLRLDYTLGQVALYLLVLLLVLTFYIPLPYRYWKWTHEWLGAVMLLGALHSILVDSDVRYFGPLTVWTIGWSILALGAYIYKRWLYYRLANRANYRLNSRQILGNLLILELESQEPLQFGPGQYGFFAWEGSRSEHAFSIMKSEGKRIVFGVKIMRNFTVELSQISEGVTLIVRGPFGMFAEKMPQADHAVWIAGGIGITPFASMLGMIKDQQKVEMYFCAKVMPPSQLTAAFADAAERKDNFRFVACESRVQGRVTAEQIWTQTGNDSRAYYFLCGPREMMEQIASDLAKLGIKRGHIIFEDFGFKQ